MENHSLKDIINLKQLHNLLFPLLYMFSNFWVLRENCKQFWNGVFEHCDQEHGQNEIQHKVYLSTLLCKRNATFHNFPYFLYFIIQRAWCVVINHGPKQRRTFAYTINGFSVSSHLRCNHTDLDTIGYRASNKEYVSL